MLAPEGTTIFQVTVVDGSDEDIGSVKHYGDDPRDFYFISLCNNGIVEPFVGAEQGSIDGCLLEPLFGLEVGTYVFMEMDSENHYLLHIKYCVPEDLHLLDDEDFWFESSAGIQERDVMLEDI